MKNLLLLLCLAGPVLAQNQVLELDGQESYVHLPGFIFDHLEEATVEAWVKWEDWAYFSQWFAFGVDDQWRAMGMNHWEKSQRLQFFIYINQSELHLLHLGTDLPLGQWCHMAAVSGRGGMRFYFNGVLVGRNSLEDSFAAIAPGPDNYLGKSNWQGNSYFRGQLDEVRVWSVARSGEQIRAAMTRRLSGGEEGLVGLWSFDAGDARDLSPQEHAGRLVGGARCVAAPFPGAEAGVPFSLIEGTVRDETGVPLRWGSVRLRQGDTQVAMWTRADGRYALAVFEAEKYVLEADLEQARPLWVGVGDMGSKHMAFQPRELLLREGEHLHQDLRAPSSQVAGWSGDGDERDGVGAHHGIRMGGAGFAPGLVGQAFSLDGEDDLIQVPPASAPDLRGSLSLVAWIFPSEDRSQVIIQKWENRLYTDREYALAVAPGLRLNFAVTDDAHQIDTSWLNFNSLPGVLTRNVWNQVAAVYDQTSGTRRIYANGVEVARRQDPPITLASGDADLNIGKHFKGLIDEVCIYRRALAGAAIQRLYGTRAEARWSGEGNADDARGANHGILVKDVGFAPGLVGQAFELDGQGSYVEFNPLIGNFGTADFTLELWLWHARAPATTAPILVKYFDHRYLSDGGFILGNEVGSALDLHLDASGRVQAEIKSSYDANRIVSTGSLAVRQWHHLALVRQGREVRLYLDGRLDTQHATAGVLDLTLQAPLTLGGAPGHERYFHGLIDEVAFHNRAFSADEIQGAYETTLGAWRWRVWRGWLEKGGLGLVVLLALFSSIRYYTQRKAQQEAHRARQIADAANLAKSAFLANMSHEIRTPMNAILGYAQILREQASLSHEQQRAVEAIHTSGDHLLGLINDVLDLTKIEAGRMELQSVDFDLGQLVKGLADMFLLRCQQQGLGWRVEQEGESWQVRGDENKLRQILVNLLGNAVKFTGTGEVVLRVRARDSALYYFEVQDTGPGMDPRQQATLFEPFQQGELGVDKGGTGLGLSIARRHVELLGGELQLESFPGQGARFFFLLKLMPSQGPVADETETRYGQVVRLAAGCAPQVLIVDDVSTNREILAQVLERIGAQVRQADSGAGALEAVRQERPDLVFMDIRMPGMNGMEALRQLRQEHGALPVAAVSASVMDHEQQYYLKSGFDAFLDKPFRLEHVYACLEELLGVEYEYAQPTATEALEPAGFDGLCLPAPLRERLYQAAEIRNVTEVKLCLEQVQELGTEQAKLAAHLGGLVQHYDLDSVLKILERTADE